MKARVLSVLCVFPLGLLPLPGATVVTPSPAPPGPWEEIEIESQSAQAEMLDLIARDLVAGPDAARRRPALGLAVAEAAVRLETPTGDSPPMEMMRTQARALFLLGRRAEAVAVMERAVAACRAEQYELEQGLVDKLAEYKRGQLPETPRSDESSPTLQSMQADLIGKVAWNLAATQAPSHGQAGVALALADAALALAKDRGNGNAIRARLQHTRARALFLLCKPYDAVTAETEAVKACDASDMVAEVELKARCGGALHDYREMVLPTAGGTPEEKAAADDGSASRREAATGFINLAECLMTAEDASRRDPKAAQRLIGLALEMAAPGEPAPLAHSRSVRARLALVLGRRKEAVELQRKAVAGWAGDDDRGKEDYEAGLAALEKGGELAVYDSDKDNGPLEGQANALNNTAWNLLTGDERWWDRPKIALAVAEVALTLADKNGAARRNLLDTRARALFMMGRQKEALAAEKEALAACTEQDTRLKPMFLKLVACYEKGVLPPAEMVK